MPKKYISLFLACTIFICCISSCNSDSRPPRLEIQTQNEYVSSEKTEIELDINSEAVELLNEKLTDFHCSCVSTNAVRYVFNINDVIYVSSGKSNSKETIHELSFATGNLEKICRDPLCDHSHTPCIEAYYCISQVIADNEIYILGEYVKTRGEGRKFIGKLDVLSGMIEVIHEWLPSSSANSLSFEYNDGYLYYTKATSDTTNEIYRFSIAEKKEEKVSSLDEYIVVFALDDNCIYYRDNYNILKKATMDFEKVVVLDDGVSIIFPIDGKLYYFKNAYTATGDSAGFDMICMDTYSLEKTTILSNIYNPSKTLYANGAFYYTAYDYQADKTVYVYHTDTDKTESYSIGRGSRCDVLGVIDCILVLKLYTDFDSSTGQRDTEYHLFDTTANQMVQIYCE